MALTFEDISNGIAENPELETQVIDFVRGKGLKVLSEEDFEKEFGKRLSPKVSELYGGIEKDILESLGKYGIKKDMPTEKVYELIKKIPGVFDAKVSEYEQQIAALKDGKQDQVSEAKIKALENQKVELETKLAEVEQGYAKKELYYKVDNDVSKAFSELKLSIPAVVADKDKDTFIQNKQQLLHQALLQKYTPKEENGSIVYYEADGTIAMKGANVATAKDLLADNYKYDFEAITKTGTGGSGSQRQQAPTIVANKDQLFEQLAKEGLVMGSESWRKRYDEIAKANNIQ